MGEAKHDTEHRDEITCPYCGCEFGDSWEYLSDGYEFEVTCEGGDDGECEKNFNVVVERTYSGNDESPIHVDYTSHKIKKKEEECPHTST